MGFFGSLFGGVKKLLGGGGSDSGAYQSQNVGKYETDIYNAIQDQKKRPLSGTAGVGRATQGFDFSPLNKAQAGFEYGAGMFSPQSGGAGSGTLFGGAPSFFKLKNPSMTTPNASFGYQPTKAFNTTYNPAKFNFAQLPQEYADTAYEAGAKNIRREAAGGLEKLRESMGTRRPGLFATAAQNAQRATGEQLGSLSAQTNLERMRENVELGRAQQMAQADEDMRGAEFAANMERANAEERFKNLSALAGIGQNKIQTQSGLLENERGYNQQEIANLLQLFQTAMGGTNQAAQLKSQNKGSTLGSLFGLAKMALPFIPGIGPAASAGLAGAGALASN